MRLCILLLLLSVVSVSAQKISYSNDFFLHDGKMYTVEEMRRYLYESKRSHYLISDYESYIASTQSGNGWKTVAVSGSVATGLLLVLNVASRSSSNFLDRVFGTIATGAGLIITVPVTLIAAIGYQRTVAMKKRKLSRFIEHFNHEVPSVDEYQIDLNVNASGLGLVYRF